MNERNGRRLVFHGALLFLLGLVTGLLPGIAANPRMAVSSHLEGVLNGTFLLALGGIWSRLELPPRAENAARWLILYGAYTNWATILLSAFTGAGAKLLPIVGAGHHGPAWAELAVQAGLMSLTVAIIAGAALVVWGAARAARASQ